MDVTVVIATYGDLSWLRLAVDRAVPSVIRQGVEFVLVHGDTLHDARNRGLAQVTTEWVCYLDADDEIEDGYFEAMANADADLRAPAVRYVRPGELPAEAEPRMPRISGHDHQCATECLLYGNWLAIGTCAPKALIEAVGGFRDWPVYEDFDLWVRCVAAGATTEPVHGAIYRAHVRRDSRNRGQLRPDEKHAVHRDIARANGIPVPA